jgi:DNA repair exonuclease SbcCD ATPase subunit
MREAVHTFDTHEYVKSFKQTGMKEVQAEAIVKAIKESRDFDFSRLATKDQIKLLQSDIKGVEQRLEAEIKGVEQRLEQKIENVEQKIENVEQKLVAEVKTIEQRLEQKIENVEQKIETSEERLRGEIKASETTVIKWVFAGLVPLMGLLIHIAMKLPS